MSEVLVRMGLNKKNILFVTGTRADFGKIEPLAKNSYRAGFDISFFITGMHMMKRYGETRLEVKQFPGAEFFEFVNQREGDSLESIIGKTISGFSDFVLEHNPDLVVIHGDRSEALAASIVCATRYIRSAHIEGGEVSGTIDESIRHCNTKLCTTHFVSNEQAEKRVILLGEEPERVFNIGSPELDMHAKISGVDIIEVKERYDIPFDEYGIVIFHSVTSEIRSIRNQAKELFEALKNTARNYVVIAPNNDPGTGDIYDVINNLPYDRFRIIPSMRFNYFSELMKNCSLFVGNSSVGVREAPFLGIASLNIGTRQFNRANSASITHCSPFEKRFIECWILENWMKRYPKSDSFGVGSASEKFVEIIKNEKFWQIELQKEFQTI